MIGAFAAYALGRFRFRGRTAVLYVMLSMTMFPQIAILGALYTMINRFELYDTLQRPDPHLHDLHPAVHRLGAHEFLPGVPRTRGGGLRRGATPLQTFYQVLLPLAAPGLVTTGLLAFIAAWNEFLFALSFTQTAENYTVTLAILSFSGESGSAFEPLGPDHGRHSHRHRALIVLTLVLQRRILAGLTAGAVKG